MSSKLTTVVVDAHDPVALSEFWRSVLGWPILDREGDEWIEIGPPDRSTTGVLLQRVDEPKHGKNRVHLDVTPTVGTQDAELERLLGLGARHADVGQGEETWVVLADPEGNEFCLLRPSGTT